MTKDVDSTNTLGLRGRDLDALLAVLDRSQGKGLTSRVFARWNFRQQSLAVRLVQPGGSIVETRMACRNLSQQGIGLLHRAYVHIGTECLVTLPHPAKGDQDYRGRVVRCLHVAGMVHEIGIRFESDIPLRDIARPDPMRESYSLERVDPASLVGTLLLVEDSDMDVKLVRHFLREIQVRIRHVTTLDEAEKEAKAGVGLVLCDIHLGEEYGGDLPRRLREHAACAPPVVMVSADRADRTYKLVTQSCVAGFLAKPFTQDSLLRTVGEFMVDPGEVQVLHEATSVQADPQIVRALMPELARACEKLRAAAESADATLALSLVMQISGVAPVMGLDELAGVAESIGQKLVNTMDLEWVTGRLGEIERLCAEAAKR